MRIDKAGLAMVQCADEKETSRDFAAVLLHDLPLEELEAVTTFSIEAILEIFRAALVTECPRVSLSTEDLFWELTPPMPWTDQWVLEAVLNTLVTHGMLTRAYVPAPRGNTSRRRSIYVYALIGTDLGLTHTREEEKSPEEVQSA